MTKQSRTVQKQEESDYINRVAPFNDPLIQKTENLQILNNKSDSAVFKISTVGSVNNPGAAFGLDFVTNDEFNVDTTSSIPSEFVITLSNLDVNQVGKINITKKTGQTFTFGNGTILLLGDQVTTQIGKAFISFEIIKAGANFIAVPLFAVPTPFVQLITDDQTGNGFTVDSSNAFWRISGDGLVQFKGFVSVTRDISGSTPFVRLVNPFPDDINKTEFANFPIIIMEETEGIVGDTFIDTALKTITIAPGLDVLETKKFFFDMTTYVL